MITQNNNEKLSFWKPKTYTEEQKVSKNKLLASAFIWFGYSMFIAFLTGIITTYAISWKTDTIGTAGIAVMLTFGILGVISLFIELFFGWRMNFYVQLVFVTFGMMFLGFTVVSLIILFTVANKTVEYLLYSISIPMLLFILFGFLSYYNKIKIKPVYILLIIMAIVMLISTIVGFFVFSRWFEMFYVTLSVFIYSLILLIDIYMISNANRYFNEQMNTKNTNKEIMKLSIYFGFKIAYDCIYLIYYLFRIFIELKN